MDFFDDYELTPEEERFVSLEICAREAFNKSGCNFEKCRSILIAEGWEAGEVDSQLAVFDEEISEELSFGFMFD